MTQKGTPVLPALLVCVCMQVAQVTVLWPEGIPDEIFDAALIRMPQIHSSASEDALKGVSGCVVGPCG